MSFLFFSKKWDRFGNGLVKEDGKYKNGTNGSNGVNLGGNMSSSLYSIQYPFYSSVNHYQFYPISLGYRPSNDGFYEDYNVIEEREMEREDSLYDDLNVSGDEIKFNSLNLDMESLNQRLYSDQILLFLNPFFGSLNNKEICIDNEESPIKVISQLLQQYSIDNEKQKKKFT